MGEHGRADGFCMFLSHDWGEKRDGRHDNHERVAQYCALLKEAGFNPWFDGDQMKEDAVAAMSKGIDSSKVVVCFITRRYIAKADNKNDNCGKEFGYAIRRKGEQGQVIAAVLEPELKDTRKWDGRVGMELGGDIFVDMTDPDHKKAVDRLISGLAKKGVTPMVKEQPAPAAQGGAQGGAQGAAQGSAQGATQGAAQGATQGQGQGQGSDDRDKKIHDLEGRVRELELKNKELEEKLAAAIAARDSLAAAASTASSALATAAAPRSTARFKPGELVKLSPGFASAADAAKGPMQPGDVGTVKVDDESSMPYQVEFEGRTWWYKAEALVAASSAEAAKSAEKPAFSVTTENAIKGLPVMRGRDWKWGDQDGGPGKVGRLTDKSEGDWWGVRWPNGSSNVYRVGNEDSYDLRYANVRVGAHGHELEPYRTGSGWRCDMCGATDSKVLRWRCGSGCDHDVCGRCVAKSSTSSSSGERIKVGQAVKVTADYEEHSDASSGPLKPGDVGRLLVDDQSDKPYQVQAPNGKTWWYVAAALEVADESEARSTAIPALAVTLANAARNLPVKRGKDWKWSDQDKSGTGRLLEDGGGSWWRVRWADGSENSYRVGAEGCYDLQYAPQKHPDHHHTLEPCSRVTGWKCDVCKTRDAPMRWRCDTDDWDACGSCMAAAGTGGGGARLKVGQAVKLSADYKDFSDAAGGPLKPGDIGVLLQDDKSDKPYQVQFKGTKKKGLFGGKAEDTRTWWYNAGALVSADASDESASRMVTAANAKAGRTVRRGKDWKWGDQDGGALETGKLVEDAGGGWWRVKWSANGESNVYRVGNEDCYDLEYVEDGDQESRMVTAATAKAGLTVIRGKDWKWGDQDGGVGCKGKLVAEEGSGWWRVKWANGDSNVYRVGKDDCFDLEFVADEEEHDESRAVTPANVRAGRTVRRGKDWKWEDQDGGPGKIGKLVAEEGTGWWRVNWANGQSNVYRVGKDDCFDLEYADDAGEVTVTSANAKAGRKVRRGKDWKWGDQDGGPGKTGKLQAEEGSGWWRVNWDNGQSNVYRVGAESCFDLEYVDDTAELRVTAENARADRTVKRGKDWKWGEQDGGAGKTGKLVAQEGSGWWRVKWSSGESNVYRVGAEGAFDLEYVDDARVTPENAKAGRVVCRGQDWKWGDQDGGPGKTGKLQGPEGTGWWRVNWDNGQSNVYRVGAEGCFDLQYAEESRVTAENAVPGRKVRRGKDWKWGDQDGGPGKTGKLQGPEGTGWYRVNWDNGQSNVYRVGAESAYDLEYADVGGGDSRVTQDNVKSDRRVKRGKDWKWGDQDGGPGKGGRLLRQDSPGWWRVKWDNGTENTYRVGAEGCHDLEYI